MGEKGTKLTGQAGETSAALVDALQPLGDVTARKMFGGYGVFGDGVMFALIDSAGTPFLRVDDSNRPRFESAGSEKHSRMPYFSIPPAVFGNGDALLDWARESLGIAQAAKK